MIIPRRAGALTAIVLLGAACASSGGVRPEEGLTTTSSSVPASTPTTTLAPSAYGGTVVVAVGDGGAPRSLNPFLDGPDTAVLDLIAPAVFARGYDIDPDTMALIPDVLTAIPSLDDGTVVELGDGTIEVTATVAPGARWADGVPITGDDLAFTIGIAADPDLPIRTDLAARYAGVIGDSLVSADRSLTFRMEAGTEYQLLFDLIIPRHAVAGSDFVADWNSTMWVAGGPFQFASWTEGQTLELTRNDNYWRTGDGDAALPFLDRVIFRFYEPGLDPDPRIADGLAAGDVDVVTLSGDGGTWREALSGIDGVEIRSRAGSSWDFLSFQFGPANRNAASLNRHLEFRRAVAHAIDRSPLAAGRGTAPLTSALAPYGARYTATPWDRYPYDPTTSISLLADLGERLGVDLSAGAGPPVVVTVPNDDAAAAALGGQVVTMLRGSGLDAQLQLEDAAIFYGPTFDNGSWDVSVGRFTAGPGLARAVAFAEIFDPAGLPFVGFNFFRWGTIDSTVSGEEVDRYAAIIAELRTTVDLDEAGRLVEEAEAMLADQVVIIPLIVSDFTGIAFRPAQLAGPAPNSAEGALWNVATWTRGLLPVGSGSDS
ncbi:MAG: hypothetical protein A2Z12_08715 [Actinobacteria bacterium RBG_16_68_21]|nr:MAG: hypothetical protein A2Z12_08715 [Actinobacteria bacterium RBG_16_68_21]